MAQAGLTTVALIYHQTAHQLRTQHRYPVVGILMTIAQSMLMVAVLVVIFTLIGLRSAPMRADFLLYIMSGIFCFLTHTQAVSAVSSSHSISAALLKHEPLTPAVMICSAALAVLYRQVLGCFVILLSYYLIFTPFTIYQPIGALAMLLMAWLVGCCIGFVFLGIRPWLPEVATVGTQLFIRVNMIASGKMMVANAMPGFLLPWFIWNPLFHIIDQCRGFMFINYSPHRTDLYYPLKVAAGLFMLGLLINFATRKYESVSWSATR